LVVVPFLIHKLGKEAYGLTGVVMSIVGLTVIADMGLRKGLTRNLAEHVATRNHDAYNRLASSAMALYLVLGGLSAFGLWVMAPWLAARFHVSPHLLGDAIFAIRVFGAGSVFITFIVQVYLGTMSSHERFDLVNYSNTFLGVFSAVLLLTVLSVTDWALRGWAVLGLLSRILYFLSVLRMAYGVSPELKLRVRFVTKAALVPVFTVGGWLFLSQAANALMQNSDSFILASVLSSTAVAVYKPALGLAAVARPFVNILSVQLNPRATAYHVTNQPERLRELLVRGSKYTFLMGVASSTVLAVFAEPIMRTWLGKALGDDTAVAAELLALWACIDLLVYAGGTQWAVLVATKQLRFPVLVYLPFAVINVVANALVLKYGGLGIPGILLPTLVIEVIMRTIITRYSAHVAGMGAWEYVRRSHLGGLKVLAVVGLVAGALRAFVPIHGLAVLLGCATVVTLVWAAAVWLIGFDDGDRTQFRSVLSHLRTKLGARTG
ncbi:MAG: oligosaccharide flippase family protein, partial [Myxococcales bacterium]|nr:oligosaccharide flippase family protein [Myxococcales bacterium]